MIEAYSGAGTSDWGDEIYKNAYCTVERHQYELAPEAVYRLKLPPNNEAKIRLDSNCVDLDLVSIEWQELDRCPSAKHNLHNCEMDVTRGGGTVIVTAVDNPLYVLVGVDGKNGATGNFRLTVDCRKYR